MFTFLSSNNILSISDIECKQNVQYSSIGVENTYFFLIQYEMREEKYMLLLNIQRLLVRLSISINKLLVTLLAKTLDI